MRIGPRGKGIGSRSCYYLHWMGGCQPQSEAPFEKFGRPDEIETWQAEQARHVPAVAPWKEANLTPTGYNQDRRCRHAHSRLDLGDRRNLARLSSRMDRRDPQRSQRRSAPAKLLRPGRADHGTAGT